MADDSRSSSEEQPHRAWSRWLMPSVGNVIFIALLGLLCFTPLSVRLLGDAGIGWHIRTGQEILATHAIPRVDLFSSTMHGKAWFAWEWLYDVLVGGLDRVAGLNAVVLFTALVIAGAFAWTFRLMMRRATNVLLAVLLVLLAASASMIHFLARPHVLSWLSTVAWFWILDSTEKQCFAGGTRKNWNILWPLPFLMLVWVNVHGGWLVGFALLGIYWISAVATWLTTGDKNVEKILLRLRLAARARELALIGAVVAVATLADPYGWKLHVHIYHYLSNRFLMDHIDEFQSPNFHGVAQRCFALLILIAFVAMGARARRVRLSEGLVALFAVYSGLVASRNIPVSSLLVVMVMGPLLSDAFGKLGEHRLLARVAELRSAGRPRAAVPTFLARMGKVESGLRGHVWAVLAVVLSCWIVLHGGFAGSRKLMDAHFDTTRFPSRAVDFVAQQNASDPVLSPDYWGGYLIYRLYPKVLVVADDRHDLYGEEFFKYYLRMMHVEPGWEALIREQQVRRVLMPKGSPVANMLAESVEWQKVYEDDVAVLFDKR